ncbi:transforming growth factor beta-1-induced transcript 1 protein, putative [Entamoeba invadens IP1]|uniref:Transforming growth factor beta-1-induced transcript 1 protein, putative n=1 Tax=Entamoeba invadens IP1 TaxID=370355 RepID=A0A0A1U6U3_ENTIV|nr:transforming growth factor beta-1-induced transcript 1 protein, putative [Entamoeba invadens IP1]ELP90045.1 transforming growth factor beta-1-induced transcript 1 protein, putative [Entamoeba invadens IP1]|eukprot:XP_004256816.1 transforming growth factor beta-1-induced transcript 1 protein, putative [Entamoeba invadens IP1]
MSDLDDLLNSLNDTAPAKKAGNQDELDDVLNALNDMVEKKQPKEQKKEDNLDDLLSSLDAKPTAKPQKQDDLDDLLDGLNDVPKPQQTKPQPKAEHPKPQAPKDDLDDLLDGLNDAPVPKAQPKVEPPKQQPKPQPPKDDLDDLLDGLNDVPKPKPAVQAQQTQPKPAAPKDDLDDLLDGLEEKPVAPKPVEKPIVKSAPKKDDLDDLLDGLDGGAPKQNNNYQQPPVKTAPKDDLDDLLDGIDTNVPKKPTGEPVPLQAIVDEDPNKCAECGQPLGPQRITALGRNYHPEHFVCFNCKSPLGTNPFHNVDNKPFCKNCFVLKFAKLCATCGKPITAGMVNALGKTYHSECFVCTKCKSPFASPQFFQKDGNPYCEQCYKEECAVKCAGCGKAIVGASLLALGQKYHPECFVCNVCKAPFPRGQFYNLDGKPVCAEHYKRGNAQNVCGRCGKPIAVGTSMISAMGQKFHPEHFLCSFCINPLTEDSFKQNGGKPYCFTCYGKLFG